MDENPQHIAVFQQGQSGEKKISGIRQHGSEDFAIEIFDIDEGLPPVIDDARPYLPADIRADLVLDFLRHPDLSLDLALLCHDISIPIVASGKKIPHALTPPT
jgi:thymidylate synthase